MIAPGRRRLAFFLLLFGPSMMGGVALRAASAAETRYLGLTLTEALLDLRDRGLEIAFTSHVVKPQMRVHTEPTASSLAGILEQLLAPHGLKAEANTSGLYVVVPGPPAISGLEGRVVVGRSSAPLGGVRILIPEAGAEAVTAADGRFSITGLAPGSYTVEAHLPGFVVERRSGVTVETGGLRELAFALEAAPVPLDEIVVTPSQVTLLRTDPVSTLAFDRDEILALPHLGDDLFRALTWLPGITGREVGADFNVRGGRTDEVLVLLDGVEVFDPYHAKDFSNLLSIIAPQAIAEVDLILGGFPAQYGDRMGGVLEMNTVRPDGDRVRLGASIFTAQAGSAGNFSDERGSWLAVARLGGVQLVEEYLDDEEKPSFWDVFAKTVRQLGEGQQLALHVLHGDDALGIGLVDEEGDTVETKTSYGNSYLWANHQAILSAVLFVDSGLSLGRVRRDRRSVETEGEEEGFSVRDERALDVLGLKQKWNLALPDDEKAAGGHYLQWGFDVRTLEAEYDYAGERALDDPLDDIGAQPRTGITVFREDLEGEQYGVYLSDRIRLTDPLTVELGLRYDEQTITGDQNVSPRLNLVYALGKAGTLRAALGHYYQSQRVYELQVEDGDTEFAPAELTRAVLVGFEHVFRGGTTLRLSAYHRNISQPRRRYENVFEPISQFPEIEPDRVLIEPDHSSSRGVELFLRGRAGRRLEWWWSYGYSQVEDEIAAAAVPRGIDQPHTVNVSLSYRATPHWTFNFAWRYHTGWPTTAIGARLEENDEGELEPVPVFGPLNAERLPDYHRLDLRASRRWQLGRGSLTFFLELQNVYDRGNQAGIDVDLEFVVRPDGTVDADPIEEAWGGFLPSFGIDWEF